jgi:hypothetical protein
LINLLPRRSECIRLSHFIDDPIDGERRIYDERNVDLRADRDRYLITYFYSGADDSADVET